MPLNGKFLYNGNERVEALLELKKDIKIINYFGIEFTENIKIIYNNKIDTANFFTVNELFSLNLNSYKSLIRYILEVDNDILIEEILVNPSQIFCGDIEKLETLKYLTVFFIVILENIEKILNGKTIDNNKLEYINSIYNILLDDSKNMELLGIQELIENYKEMEKIKWKIIGSKD